MIITSNLRHEPVEGRQYPVVHSNSGHDQIQVNDCGSSIGALVRLDDGRIIAAKLSTADFLKAAGWSA